MAQDATSIYNIPYHFWKPILAKIFGKKILIYGMGVGPIETKLGKMIVKLTMTMADKITTRDGDSKNILREFKVDENKITVGSDPSVTLPTPTIEETNLIYEKEGISLKKPIIGVCLRNWFDLYKYLPINLVRKFGLRTKNQKIRYETFIGNISYCLDYLVKEFDVNILFIPFWKGRDDIVHNDVRSSMKHSDRVYEVKGDYSPSEIKGLISKLTMLIGMRLHSIIFSSTVSTPFVAINYQPKIKSYVDELIENKDISTKLVLELEDMNSKSLIITIDYVMNNLNKISEALIDSRDRLKALNLKNIEMLNFE